MCGWFQLDLCFKKISTELELAFEHFFKMAPNHRRGDGVRRKMGEHRLGQSCVKLGARFWSPDDLQGKSEGVLHGVGRAHEQRQ